MIPAKVDVRRKEETSELQVIMNLIDRGSWKSLSAGAVGTSSETYIPKSKRPTVTAKAKLGPNIISNRSSASTSIHSKAGIFCPPRAYWKKRPNK